MPGWLRRACSQMRVNALTAVGTSTRESRPLLGTVEKRQRPVEFGRFPGGGQLLVGWERRAKGPSHEGRIRSLLLRADRPEIETRGCAYRWTSARARHGLPDPLTSFNGATTRTAPVGGSFARLASWVRPYLFAPRRN